MAAHADAVVINHTQLSVTRCYCPGYFLWRWGKRRNSVAGNRDADVVALQSGHSAATAAAVMRVVKYTYTAATARPTASATGAPSVERSKLRRALHGPIS